MHYWNEEERKEKHERFTTVPMDPRYPNTNQAKRCYANYIDFYKCAKSKGEDAPVCQEFKFAFKEICPPFWTDGRI
jgi:cytochrome c oxidase subunit 6b